MPNIFVSHSPKIKAKAFKRFTEAAAEICAQHGIKVPIHAMQIPFERYAIAGDVVDPADGEKRTIITVALYAGRPRETLARIAQDLTARTAKIFKVNPETVEIGFQEMHPETSFIGGKAVPVLPQVT